MSRAGRKPGTPNKLSILATSDMDRLEINPIEMLKRVFDEAMSSYETAIPSEKGGDPGAAYLGVAARVASDLAGFKHPKLSAIAIKDMTDDHDQARPVTTQEAIEIIRQDPFAVKTSEVVKQINSTIETPVLPVGEK